MESIAPESIDSKKKRGEVRADGRIFWRHRSDGREVWVTPEKVEEVRVKEYARVKACMVKAKVNKMAVLDNRIKRGFTREDGMIFWAYSPDGSEQWVTPDERLEKQKKSKQAKRKHYANNRESELERARQWRADNPEVAAASFKASREKFRGERIQQTRDWRDRNVEHVKAYAKKYQVENAHIGRANCARRYAEDELFQLRCRLRSRTFIAFRQKGFSKDSKTADMLGCSWDELKEHIEKQFARGMCWERFDEIEVDHVIPVASAKTKEELVKLFRFENLQPLWWWENRDKRDKMPEDWKIPVDEVS
jgi:hypothetical protein